MVNQFKNKLPSGFYETITRKVVTLDAIKKGVTIGEITAYDMEAFFNRALILSDKLKICHDTLFDFELSAYPAFPFPFLM